MSRTTFLAIIGLLPTVSLAAQQKAVPGDRVAIIVRGRSDSVLGNLTNVTNDSIVVSSSGKRTAVARNDIDHAAIWRGNKSHIKTGALTGMTLGLVGGGIGGGVAHSNCDSDCFFGSSGTAIVATGILFATAGAAAGGLIGAMFGHDIWEPATF